MTTVAWDGKTLAADRRVTYGSVPLVRRKVFRICGPDGRRYLLGFSGQDYALALLLFWMRHPHSPPPKILHDDHINALLVNERNQIFAMSNTALVWCPIRASFYGIGSGGDHAEGAMAAGATAREAVRIAMRFDVHSGGGVDSISFEGRSRRITGDRSGGAGL